MRAATRWPAMNSSATVMLEAREVSFTMPMRELERAGTAVRRACGSTMRRMICHQLMPTQQPASSWPCGTLSSAPRMVSAQYAPSLKAKAMTAAGKAFSMMPALGRP